MWVSVHASTLKLPQLTLAFRNKCLEVDPLNLKYSIKLITNKLYFAKIKLYSALKTNVSAWAHYRYHDPSF